MGWALLLTLLLLPGCAVLGNQSAIRAAVADQGAEAADALLESAEWVICQASSVGAVRRRYGGSEAHLAAYGVLCAPRAPVGAVP